MTTKEEIISALAGILIGCVFGYFVSQKIVEKSKEHQLLIQENRILRQQIMNCQESR